MEERILQLVGALRASGVRISLAESADAFYAIDLMGATKREEFRLSLRTTLIKNARDLPIFDKLFPLFFRSSQPPIDTNKFMDDLTPDEIRKLAEALRYFSEKLRENIERLLKGDPLSQEQLEMLSKMVGLNNITDLNYQNWMAQRMERAMGFPELRETIKRLLEMLQDMDFNPERLSSLRDLLLARMQGIGEQMDIFAGERIAENLSRAAPTNSLDDLSNRSFQSLSEAEKRLLLTQVRRLVATLRTRIALRQKRAKDGHLDAKATIRANLKHNGVPIQIRHRDQTKKPKIVILCDVSTSMRFCSELMLSFIFALQGAVRKTHAFAFIDHLEYITDDLANQEATQAISSVLQRMPSGSYNTNLGNSLENFYNEYLDCLNGHSTLIIVGDGRNNYNDPRIDIFTEMSRRAAQTLWLNPESREMWGTGDSDMPGYAALCNSVLKVSNLAELASAIDQLLAT